MYYVHAFISLNILHIIVFIFMFSYSHMHVNMLLINSNSNISTQGGVMALDVLTGKLDRNRLHLLTSQQKLQSLTIGDTNMKLSFGTSEPESTLPHQEVSATFST